jgi:SAM-dependent methyltransferase
MEEGFFDRLCQGRGLDIGHGGDLLCENCVGYDLEDGDAGALDNISDGTFDFVYASHVLEHIPDPARALRNWLRVVKPNGYLIIVVPHRDLYEKRDRLPSRWNPDHKHFFLPETDEAPDSIGLRQLIREAIPEAQLIYLKVRDQGHTISDPDVHSDGEYSIEAVLQLR